VQFVIQSDGSLLYSDLSRVFGEISGISLCGTFLSIMNDRIIPLSSGWTSDVYTVMRPLMSQQSPSSTQSTPLSPPAATAMETTTTTKGLINF